MSVQDNEARLRAIAEEVMAATVERARAACPARATLASFVLPAWPASLVGVLGALGDGPVVYFDPGERVFDKDHHWRFAGRGVAARVDGAGPAALAMARRGADAVFARLVEHRAHDASGEVPAAKFFGGAAFAPGATRGTAWDGFGDASFVLPRWLYALQPVGVRERACVRLTVAAEELDDAPRLAREICTVNAALLEASNAELRAGGVTADQALAATRAAARAVRAPSAQPFEALVSEALAEIRARRLTKVVAARSVEVCGASPYDLGATLRALYGASGGRATVFAMERGDRVFVGATPECLVRREGSRVVTEALAGTGRDALALLKSDKDRREHALVVAGIREALAPRCERVRAQRDPTWRRHGEIAHLCTPITATLAAPHAHVLELLEALHPTPAVCGTPRAAARAFIAAHERDPRGWYAGPVGWFDAAGDGAFAVAIRSAVLDGARAWAFAGAGIVDGSDPAAEYRETAAKLRPMLAALGVEADA